LAGIGLRDTVAAQLIELGENKKIIAYQEDSS
jgi:hypothetical protein